MADGYIEVSGLVANGAAGQIVLNWQANDPSPYAGLPNMKLDKFEIWADDANWTNIASATKVGESEIERHAHTGLAPGTFRFYRVRARDLSGNAGEFYPPLSAPAVQAMALNKLSDITPDLGDITAGRITGALIRTNATGSRVEISSADKRITFWEGSTERISLGLNKGNSGNVEDAPVYVWLTGTGLVNGAVFYHQNGIGLYGRNSNANYAAIVGENFHPGNAAGAFFNQGGGVEGQIRLGLGQGAGGWAARAIGGNGIYSTVFAPFTGGHEGLIDKASEMEVGDIICDVRVIARHGISDTVTEVAVADTAYQRGAVGVVSRREALPNDMQLAALPPPTSGKATTAYRKLQKGFDYLFFNAVGEGQINVCGRGGDIELGDFIVASDLRGKGQRADMDAAPSLRAMSAIVARSREPVTFDHPDQVKRVACIYMCG